MKSLVILLVVIFELSQTILSDENAKQILSEADWIKDLDENSKRALADTLSATNIKNGQTNRYLSKPPAWMRWWRDGHKKKEDSSITDDLEEIDHLEAESMKRSKNAAPYRPPIYWFKKNPVKKNLSDKLSISTETAGSNKRVKNEALRPPWWKKTVSDDEVSRPPFIWWWKKTANNDRELRPPVTWFQNVKRHPAPQLHYQIAGKTDNNKKAIASRAPFGWIRINGKKREKMSSVDKALTELRRNVIYKDLLKDKKMIDHPNQPWLKILYPPIGHIPV